MNRIIAVVKEMKERIVLDTSISADKITVITNSEKKDFIANFNLNEDSFFIKHKDRFIISYVGGFGPHSSLQTPMRPKSTNIRNNKA